MLTRLMYISFALLPAADVQQALQAITDTSTARNASLSVTGALLYTGTHFSQVIEGMETAIDTLMASIRADQRHRDIRVVEHLPVPDRLFAGWSTVYTGPSRYVQQVLDECLERPDERRRHQKLLKLLREFARD